MTGSFVRTAAQHPSGTEQLELGSGCDEPLAQVEDLGATAWFLGDRGHPDQRPAMQVLVPDLGHRDLVGTPQLGDHRADEPTLLLERVDVAQEDVELEGSHEHDVLLVVTRISRAASRASRTSR